MPRKKAPPLTPKQQEKKKNEKNFKAFVKRETKKNPNLSARDAVKKWRSKGKAIGNDQGQDIVRQVKGLKISEKKQKSSRTRVKMYGLGDRANPKHIKTLLKDKRYMYVVGFEVFKEGMSDPMPEALNLVSNRKLSRQEVEDGVLQHIEDMKNATGDNKYKTLGLVDGSVQVLYGIDTQKGVKMSKG